MAIENQNVVISANQVANAVVGKLVANPKIDMQNPGQVQQAVVKETAAVLTNQTNQEPWYKSTIIVTQYVTLIASLLGLFGIILEPELKEAIITAVLSIGAVVGPLVTLWARIRAKKGLVVTK